MLVKMSAFVIHWQPGTHEKQMVCHALLGMVPAIPSRVGIDLGHYLDVFWLGL
jgi:hypothetical protein